LLKTILAAVAASRARDARAAHPGQIDTHSFDFCDECVLFGFRPRI
jgi:hypothetical protein